MLSLQVLSRSQLIFPFKTWFFKNLFEFSAAEIITKINISHILHTNLTKYIPLIPAHQYLSNSTKAAFQFL
jgi:hypothetical protein